MNILCFDVESNGLHGKAFAVAGVLIGPEREVLSQFVARCPITGPLDTWVKDNVIGPMASIADTHSNSRDMRDAFWNWYKSVLPKTQITVAANPYPVEARFLIACQTDNMAEREFDHPFPYYDLSSMLYTLGFTTPAMRREFVVSAVADLTGDPHNPLWDALTTGIAAQVAVSKNISKLSATGQTIVSNSKASA